MQQLEIVQAIRQGKAEFQWSELHSGPVTFRVTSDAVKIGGIRVPVSAETTQEAAEVIGALPTTPLVEDLIYQTAPVRVAAFPGALLAPCPSAGCGHTAKSKFFCTLSERLYRRAVEHSAQIDNVLGVAGVKPGVLVATVGKSWVLSNHSPKGKATNYGWHSKGAPYASASLPNVRVWQPVSSVHNAQHADYSQTLRLLHSKCLVDGFERSTAEVLRDAHLARHLSHEGPLRSVRVAELPHDTEPEISVVFEKDEPTRPSIPTPAPDAWRVLKRGMNGPDVRAWQKQLEYDNYEIDFYGGADGKFGAGTEKLTIRWQQDRAIEEPEGLGRVGRATISAIGRPPIPEDPPSDSLEADGPLWLAKNYTKVGRARIDLVVIHTMEAPEKPDTAEGIAAWFAGKRGEAPKASAHACVDNDSLIRCVPPEHVAWAAPGANGNGYQIEHAGYAKQTREQWLDAYSKAMLSLSARHAGKVARLYGIPFELVDVAGLRAKRRGFTEHRFVSLAFGKSDHWDPGKAFPWDWYLAEAKRRS